MDYYWDPIFAAYNKVREVIAYGDQCDQEDVVQHVWTEVARTHFPSRTATGESWPIDREPYRGTQQPSAIRPDIISIKYSPLQGGGAYFDDRIVRDYLNIECKAASHHTPAGWRDAIIEATEFRLAQYQTRDVYLCIAVGRFFMFFAWCPNTPIQNPLWMQDQSRRQNFDPRLLSIGGPWVNSRTGEINYRRAMSINYDNVTHRQAIETTILGIRGTVLPGEN